jgi:hypothetical protein
MRTTPRNILIRSITATPSIPFRVTHLDLQKFATAAID